MINGKKIAIVDSEYRGHHLEYLYNVYDYLNKINMNSEIHLFCNHRFADYAKENSLREVKSNKNIKIVEDKFDPLRGSWLQKTKLAINHLTFLKEFDEIIMMDINHYFPALLSMPSYSKILSVRGIYFNPFYREKNIAKNIIRKSILFLLSKLYKNRAKIFILNDPIAATKINENLKTNIFRSIPDPIPEYFYNDINHGKKYLYDFAMIGVIDDRKGIYQFLESIKLSKKENRDMISGRVKREHKVKVKSTIENLLKQNYHIDYEDRFLSNQEFVDKLSKSKVILLPYLTRGLSSGILGHAVAANRPVLGTSKGLLGDLIKAYNLGTTFDPKDLEMFSHYLNNIHEIKYDENGRKKYLNRNSIAKFCSILFSGLDL